MPDSPASPARREQAAVAGHLGRADTARGCLDDADPAVRATALRALDRAGDLRSGELDAALGDPAAVVRVAAVELAATRADVALDVAAALLDDADSRVAEAAAWACGEKASAAPPDPGSSAAAVVARLARLARTHEDALCRESAIAALGAIGDPAGLPVILAGLDDKPAVRRRAVIALAPFDGVEVDEALARAERDRDRQVRAAAADLRAS